MSINAVKKSRLFTLVCGLALLLAVTPLVFAQTGGRSCIAVAALGSSTMLVSVTGFVN